MENGKVEFLGGGRCGCGRGGGVGDISFGLRMENGKVEFLGGGRCGCGWGGGVGDISFGLRMENGKVEFLWWGVVVGVSGSGDIGF